MKKLLLACLALAAMAIVPAHAQFNGFPKMGGGGGGNVDNVMASGSKIIICSTIASDLAVNAASQMLSAFPDDKVAAIKEKFSKYNELKGKRGDEGQLDSDSATLASDGFKEMEKLDVAGYQKDKAKVVGPAYSKMGLALGVDALAAIQLPGFMKSCNSTISSMGSNPMQATKLMKLKSIAATGMVLSTSVPAQVADAENIKLGEAPKVTALEPAALQSQQKTMETEG